MQIYFLNSISSQESHFKSFILFR